MLIKVQFFANLKDIAGVEEMAVEVEKDATVGDLLPLICDRAPDLKQLLETRRVFISLNQEMGAKNDTLTEGDEVGLLPPFSGGKK